MNLKEDQKQNWSKKDIISFIESSQSVQDSHSILWDMIDNRTNVSDFIHSLKEIMHPDTEEDIDSFLEIVPKRNKLATINGSLDFIFDHYFPMIEATNIDIKDEKLILSRINIIQMLCNLLIDFPYNINPYYVYHKAMWNILLKIMRRCDHNINSSLKSNLTQSHPLILEAFRSAINLYEKTKKRISQKTQASRLLSLVINNQKDPFLHSLTVRFAMKNHPQEFGFVTLCKQLIGNGIKNPLDLGFIQDILNLPCVRDPTDVYKYLFTLAVSHKILSNSAMHVVENTFTTFAHLTDVKTWCTLFVKRCFEFILFSLHKKGKNQLKNDQPKTKYCRKIYLIRRFYDKLYKLKIDWLSSIIQKSAYTIISIDEDCSVFLSNHYELSTSEEEEDTSSSMNIETDEKIKDDIMSINLELVDLKKMLKDIKITIPMIHSPISTTNNQSAPNTERKPTISEIRSQYLKSKSKLSKKKSSKSNTNQINDSISILMNLNNPKYTPTQETNSNIIKESQCISKENEQSQLKSNENQNVNSMTEII